MKKKKRFSLLKFYQLLFGLIMFIPMVGSVAANDTQCVISDTCSTVIIDGCDTGVRNYVDKYSCTISDKIKKCAIETKNKGQFLSCVAILTNSLKKTGVITGKELGTIQSCTSKANVPCGECDNLLPSQHRFCFEYRSDDMSITLQRIKKAYFHMPQNANDFEEIQRLALLGQEFIQSHPDETATLLVAEASRFSEKNVDNLMLLFSTLGKINSSIGVNYLFEMSVKTYPSIDQIDERQHMNQVILRQTAISQLGRLHAAGNDTAKKHLLNLVGNQDKRLKIKAIEVFYNTSGPRWRAKRAMKPYLAPEDEYLLYEIY